MVCRISGKHQRFRSCSFEVYSAEIREEHVMTSSFKWRWMIGAALLVVGVSFAFAQAPSPAGQGAPMYDLKTETTIKGTVESVETITGAGGRGRRGVGGTHLVVKTEKDSVEVHVGPTAYLAEKKITLAKGDKLEILGSRVTVDNETFLIARQIKKGDNTWTLRDASGRPAWSGRGR
jgi:hypothetical protein